MAHEAGGASKATRDDDEASQQAAIDARISAAESDISQAVRDGFRAGATANEVMEAVIAATAEGAGDAQWARSLRDRLRMHGLNEIVRVLQADPAKAEEFATFARERAEQEALEPAGAAADSQATGAASSPGGVTMRGALLAYECLAHPDCGPVTALGPSGHGHHSGVTGLWCWHFTDFHVAQQRAQGNDGGDAPPAHKTYPTPGPHEGYWSSSFAVRSRLTRKSVVPAPRSSSDTWRAYGVADAPIAMRAISRALGDEPHAGRAFEFAIAIIKAYGPDMTRVGPNVMHFDLSEARVKLLSSFMADANRTEWEAVFLSAPEDYMFQYRAGFIAGLDQEMANWMGKPTHPPKKAELVAEEERWQRALIMGGIDLERAMSLGDAGARERRGWRRFLPGGRG